jgi:prepilin-type N-terminal cleavage/methylation domain-containing protein/prepilin-type processing-associated H-X9-DG protein
MSNKKGFTLIELLVVIAIIALLLSIVVPSLQLAKEHARRVTCSSNLKSIGTGLYVFANTNQQKLIPNVITMAGKEAVNGITSSNCKPWYSYFAGVDDPTKPDQLKAVQLGRLFSEGIVNVPDIYYCPTAKLTSQKKPNDDAPKTLEYYTTNLVKHMPPGRSGWGSPTPPSGSIRCSSNYQYWTWEKTKLLDVSLRPLVVDSLLTVAHTKGGNPYGVNALFGDGHVNMTRFEKEPELLSYVMRDSWEDKAMDSLGFVQALKRLAP